MRLVVVDEPRGAGHLQIEVALGVDTVLGGGEGVGHHVTDTRRGPSHGMGRHSQLATAKEAQPQAPPRATEASRRRRATPLGEAPST